MKNKSQKNILIVVAILLSIPLIAMQFTDEVSWTILDFVVMGILLLSIGFICELTIRKVSKIKHRIAICITILVVFLLIWAELAVGIFGTPFAGS
jgi:dipeptide/tripeptide permease